MHSGAAWCVTILICAELAKNETGTWFIALAGIVVQVAELRKVHLVPLLAYHLMAMNLKIPQFSCIKLYEISRKEGSKCVNRSWLAGKIQLRITWEFQILVKKKVWFPWRFLSFEILFLTSSTGKQCTLRNSGVLAGNYYFQSLMA